MDRYQPQTRRKAARFLGFSGITPTTSSRSKLNNGHNVTEQRELFCSLQHPISTPPATCHLSYYPQNVPANIMEGKLRLGRTTSPRRRITILASYRKSGNQVTSFHKEYYKAEINKFMYSITHHESDILH